MKSINVNPSGSVNSCPGNGVGDMLPHEAPLPPAEDNVLHLKNFQKGATHPDSKGAKGMHGDGPKGSHYTGH